MKPKLPLSGSERVSFAALFLDINNPRLGSERRHGYEEAKALFDPKLQAEAEATLGKKYPKLAELKLAIVNQGWTPIDSILVWEHPDKKGKYVVVEGNTRTTALRQIRKDLEAAKTELARLEKKGADKDSLDECRREIKALEQVIADTDQIEVRIVNVKTADELEKVLPHILGVRHIKHPQQWGPFAQNLYLFKLYEKQFHTEHGEKKLILDNNIVAHLAAILSQGHKETKEGIQSACAFLRFKLKYEDRLPGEDFEDEDHYFFEQILDTRYAREQFKFGENDLELKPEMQEVLFKWAFAKPRKGSPDENKNVLYKAENIRQWGTMAKYDAKPENRTPFASQLDVNNPDTASNFRELEAEYLSHKASKGPTKVVEKLIEELKSTPVATLIAQRGHLQVSLEELQKVTNKFLKLIEAAK